MLIDIKNRAQIRVRYEETDKMGVVYNGNYFTYFEVGRAELMRSHGMAYIKFENQGYFLPLLESFAAYKSPAFYDDLLEVEAHLQWDIAPTLKFNYKIFRDDTLICEGYTLHSFLDAETRKPIRPPKIFVDEIKKIADKK